MHKKNLSIIGQIKSKHTTTQKNNFIIVSHSQYYLYMKAIILVGGITESLNNNKAYSDLRTEVYFLPTSHRDDTHMPSSTVHFRAKKPAVRIYRVAFNAAKWVTRSTTTTNTEKNTLQSKDQGTHYL